MKSCSEGSRESHVFVAVRPVTGGQFGQADGKRVIEEVNGVSLPPSTSDLTRPKLDRESPVQESSAAIADSERDHPHVLAPASLITGSAVSNVEPRLFFNIELNGRIGKGSSFSACSRRRCSQVPRCIEPDS